VARNDKEAARLEAEIAALRGQVEQLAADSGEARKAAKKWRRKRIQLEEAVGRQLAPLRESLLRFCYVDRKIFFGSRAVPRQCISMLKETFVIPVLLQKYAMSLPGYLSAPSPTGST